MSSRRQPRHSRPAAPFHGLPLWLPVSLILLAGLAAYGNSFAGLFVFDDEPAIVENPHIRSLWPLTGAMTAPAGTTVSGRPVVSLTLALNYALSPADVRDVLSLPPQGAPAPVDEARLLANLWGYHALNLAIHLAAALLLYGIVRRTLRTAAVPPVWRESAGGLALAAAAIWVAHPLLTGSVTYVIQRAESLMGLFYLLTVYAAIRALESARWAAVAALACALGMGSKEAMVTAPLAVVAWDWLFLDAGGPAGMPGLRRRRLPLYGVLAASWIVLALLVAGNHRPDAAGFGFAEWPWWRYFLTQTGVITHYLRLALWPSPLVLDYAWPPAENVRDVLPPLLVLVALGLATGWGLLRRRPWAFPGVWFFLTLAPTSSVLPIVTEIAAEQRMYLPLAAVVVAAVVTGRLALAPQPAPRRRAVGWAMTSLVVLAAVATTRARNEDYQSFERIWRDTIAKQPGNARARTNYATALLAQGRYGEAEDQARAAVGLEPALAEAHGALGVALCAQHRCPQGIAELEAATRLAPPSADGYRNLGEAYASIGDMSRALAHYVRALQLRPDDVRLLNRVGWILATAADAGLRDGARAQALADRAVALTGRGDVESLDTLAAAQAEQGAFAAAALTAQQALTLAPRSAPEMVPELEQRLALYRTGRPMRQ